MSAIYPADPDTTFTVAYESDESSTGYGYFEHVTADQLGAVVAVLARQRGQTVYVTPTGYQLPQRTPRDLTVVEA